MPPSMPMKPRQRSWTAAPPRRRRYLFFALALLFGALYFWLCGAPSFSTLGLGFSPDSSPAGLVAQARHQYAGEGPFAHVREVDALLHFVLAHPERRLDEDGGSIRVEGLGSVAVNGSQTVDLRVYAPDGDYAWAEHARNIQARYPLVVFSKTYCPYSKMAKALLAAYDLSPPPKIIEINVRSDGPQVQAILSRLTGRSTVPNILLRGHSIGGSDDVQLMHEERRLKKVLEEGGILVKGDVNKA